MLRNVTATFNVHEVCLAMYSSNVSNANFRPPGGSSEGAHEASAQPTGWFGSSVIKSLFAGFGSAASAGDTASELPQGCNIRQREVSAAKPPISEERRIIYIENLLNIDKLIGKLTDEVYGFVCIPIIAESAAELLVRNEQSFAADPAALIKDLNYWNRHLMLGLESRYFDSSQTITSEFATQTLKEFRTRLNKLLSIPDLERRMKSFSQSIAAMRPECETNRLALEDPLCLPAAEDKVISTAKKLRELIKNGYSCFAELLSATPGSKKNHDLKKELDVCIQNILFMQGTKEATIAEVQI